MRLHMAKYGYDWSILEGWCLKLFFKNGSRLASKFE